MSLAQFGQTVKAKHPEYNDLSDEDVANKVLAKYPQYSDMVAPGVPKAPTPAGLQGPPSQPSLLDKAAQGVKDFGTGIAKGGMTTLLNVGKLEAKIPGVKSLMPGDVQDMLGPEGDQITATHNTTQAVGKGLEQTGEFFTPMGAEEKLATKGAELLPQLGKFAAPVSRIVSSALASGAVNKAQGGSFTAGAGLGAGGGALSEGLRVAAPIVAESALGIRGVDRRAPITPGRAILDETTGVNPRNIADQAKAKQTLYTAQRDALLQNAPDVDLTAARQVASDAGKVAASRNNPETIKRVGQVGDLLNYEGGKPPASPLTPPKVISGFGPPAAVQPPAVSGVIPSTVSATRANALKQGLGELKGSWNPAVPNDFADSTVGKTYGALDSGIDNAAPGTSGLNNKISSLFPVAQRATATDLNANALQRVLGRFTRPTGALVGLSGGGYAGYKEGGIGGAVAGGAAGLVAPELIGSPTFQMGLARGFSNGATPVVRALLGGGIQSTRKNSLY